MICNECKSKMRLDDQDLICKGLRVNYWVCDNCQTSCNEEIKFEHFHKEYWHNKTNTTGKDYVRIYRR